MSQYRFDGDVISAEGERFVGRGGDEVLLQEVPARDRADDPGREGCCGVVLHMLHVLGFHSAFPRAVAVVMYAIRELAPGAQIAEGFKKAAVMLPVMRVDHEGSSESP